MTARSRRWELPTRAYLLILVAALLVPVVAFTGFVLWRFAEAERDRYQAAALYAAERIAAAVDRELAGLESGLQALSTGRSFGERAYDRFYERAQEVKRTINADVILKDATGQQLMNTRVPFGTSLPRSLQDHERMAIAQNRSQVSDIFQGAFSGRPIISVALPLARDGGAVNLLTIAIGPARFADLLQAQALPESWTAAIIDRKGGVVARSRDNERFAGARVMPDLQGRYTVDKATWQGEMADGTPALLAFARPQLAEGWRVTVAVPVEVAHAPLTQALISLAVAGAFALLLSGAVAAWMGERAARAMGRLAGAAAVLGASRPVEPFVTPVREINRVGAALVDASMDLATRDRERRAAEEALRALNENLEAAIEERSSQLVQLQKLESIGQLTGGVAHDFNNLLMAVMGSLELLRKRLGDDPRALRLLDNAMQGAQRGATLTQRLLAFARRQELAPTAIDVAALVSGMSELLRRSLGPQVELELRFPPGLPPASADANQLELAVLNLAVNGRDAMGQGGRITIAARADRAPAADGEAGFVVLCVSDTGSGMSEETLKRAAEPFFTTKGVGKGTGLGLSMVHGLAQQSGGRLALESREGVGTTAELWLPVADPASVAAAVPEAAAVERRAPGTRILIVDDDPLVLLGTADLLEDLGHHVVEASSGRQALEILAAGARIDLVVTDYAMPGMTGLELIERIRRTDPDMPAILATGFSEAPDIEGVSFLRLAKPFNQASLAGMVALALKAESRPDGKVVRLARARI